MYAFSERYRKKSQSGSQRIAQMLVKDCRNANKGSTTCSQRMKDSDVVCSKTQGQLVGAAKKWQEPLGNNSLQRETIFKRLCECWLLIEKKQSAQSPNSNFGVTFVCSYTAVHFNSLYRAKKKSGNLLRATTRLTCNATMLRDKLNKNAARITWSLKEKFTPEWPFIFFTPIKSLYKNMLFTKISAPNERYIPTKSFSKVVQNPPTFLPSLKTL